MLLADPARSPIERSSRARPAGTFAFLAAAGALLAGGPVLADKSINLPKETLDLARETNRIEQQVELASSDQFYLVLDPVKSRLQLLLRGVVLRDYPIRRLDVGARRVLFRPEKPPTAWESRIWKNGTLDPFREDKRIEIIPPKPDANGNLPEAEPPTAPLPEEKPAPSDYCIRFTEGFAIEIQSPGPEVGPGALEKTGFWARTQERINTWWAGWRAFVKGSPGDRLHLRVMLDQEDARALYRSLPPGTGFMLLLPTRA